MDVGVKLFIFNIQPVTLHISIIWLVLWNHVNINGIWELAIHIDCVSIYQFFWWAITWAFLFTPSCRFDPQKPKCCLVQSMISMMPSPSYPVRLCSTLLKHDRLMLVSSELGFLYPQKHFLLASSFWCDVVFYILWSTLPETNIAPESKPLQKEISSSNHWLSRAMFYLFFANHFQSSRHHMAIWYMTWILPMTKVFIFLTLI